MVSRRRRGIQDKAALGRRIKQIIRENPAASQRGIARQLRSEGFKGANDLIRGITRVVKAESDTLDRALAAKGRTLKQLQTNVRNLLIAVGEGISPIISVAVDWEATVVVEFFTNGQSEGSRQIRAKGRIVQPLEAFDSGLINERIATQLEGQGYQAYTRKGQSKGQSYVEDLQLIIKSIKYNKLDAFLKARR